MKKFVTVVISAEDFDNDYVCVCGNTVMEEGFHPCTNDGEIVEPIEGLWDGRYLCQRCELMISPK